MHGADDTTLRRLEDFDRRYMKENLAVAVGVFLVSFVGATRYGPAIIALGAVPLLSALVGFASLRQRLGLVSWHVLHFTTISVANAGAALLTGGTQSPVFGLIPCLGLMWVGYFPERRLALAGAPLTTVVVIALDDSIGNVLSISVPLLNSVLLPLLALRLVESELLHRHRAVIDQLTGCLNRHAFATRKDELNAQLARTGDSVGVVLLDIDHFKDVNDTHGHLAGDQALVELSDSIRSRLRGFELFYRLGGEEFVLLLPGGQAHDAVRLAEVVRTTAQNVEVHGTRLTVSCGVAIADATTNLDQAMVNADAALYDAKRAGRNRSVLAA